ncbi:MAG: FHA domain-containing protein, partial [Gemmatimonadetes bacterium]|nr:FHA domain-containing protein [Gemmatimonadota bacterium]
MAYLEIGGQRRTIPPGEVSIGSDPSSQILLTGPGVAPRHAVVQGAADGQVVVRKASDAVEVLINGVRLGPQPTPLLHGDKVQIGGVELHFVDERRSGSTQYVQAVNPATLAGMKPGAKKGGPTGTTGGRLVSLTDGREYAVTGQSLVLGRDASCDVVLTDKSVSRRHAEIMATPKGYMLVDSSTNGTFVGGERVEGQRLLARADVIRCGDEEFRFYADVVAPAPPQTASAPAAAPPDAAHPGVPRLANTMFGMAAPKAPAPPAPPVSPRTGEEPVLGVPAAAAQATPAPPTVPAPAVAAPP